MKLFDEIVSLGSFCQTTYQLKKLFPAYRSSMFDWWVTPTFGLVRLFEEDFKNIFRYDYLHIVDEGGAKAVMCGHYGIMHYHDFEKPEDRVFNLAGSEKGEVRPILIRSAIERNLQRIAYLYKRLAEMRGDVLFVRVGDGHVMYYDQNGGFSDELVDRLICALIKVAPDINPTLLLLNGSYTQSNRSDVICDVVDNKGVSEWFGDENGWKELFMRIQFGHVRSGSDVADGESKGIVRSSDDSGMILPIERHF